MISSVKKVFGFASFFLASTVQVGLLLKQSVSLGKMHLKQTGAGSRKGKPHGVITHCCYCDQQQVSIV